MTPSKTPSASADAHAPSTAQDSSVSLRQQIEILERENRLMASAYHSLAGRLQLNSVTLQRRSEQPLTWLNRQRKEVIDSQKMIVPEG